MSSDISTASVVQVLETTPNSTLSINLSTGAATENLYSFTQTVTEESTRVHPVEETEETLSSAASLDTTSPPDQLKQFFSTNR